MEPHSDFGAPLPVTQDGDMEREYNTEELGLNGKPSLVFLVS